MVDLTLILMHKNLIQMAAVMVLRRKTVYAFYFVSM